MASPNAIADLCDRYKLGNNWVTSWIVTSATLFKSKNDNIVKPASRRIKPKQQTKKRKLKDLTVDVNRSIHTKELLEYAAYIEQTARATQEPPSGIHDVILVLRDVIHGRKECASWYSSQHVSSEIEAAARNDGHEQFIDALETVQAHLEQAVVKSTNKTPLRNTMLTSPISAELFSNSFGLLPMEQSPDSPSTLPPIPQESNHLAKPTRPAGTTITLRDDPQDKHAFEVWCALCEGFDIHQFLRTLWKTNRNGKLIL